MSILLMEMILVKKILIILVLTFSLFGCSSLGNSPTSKVEDLLTKYQMLDKDIKNEIEAVVDKEDLTDEQKDRYTKLLEKQYKNLSYEVKDEKEDGNLATITVEIEVLDYRKAIVETDSQYSIQTDYSTLEYNNTKLDNLEAIKDNIVYTIEFKVTKDEDGNWSLNQLSTDDLKKIQGMY